ncbi:MAG: glycosyltransferase family 2 protein [Opitutales bacterium]|nr:glycosyltransferase family 2 protein [Opitutales bacterium]
MEKTNSPFDLQSGDGSGDPDDPLVSIVIRSYNEAWALPETLGALAEQTYHNWELIVLDSGSTDNSADLIRAAKPKHFIQNKPGTYNPSRVMNHGMRLASSNYVVFLNADATPLNANWLAPLVRPLKDPRVAAVFGCQVPRADCRAVYAADYDRCFGPHRAAPAWPHFFSMVNSGIRKDIWALRGFNEKMQYSEDDEYTRWCRGMGYQFQYVPASCVTHSHNYTPSEAARRQAGEARALAMVWEGDPSHFNFARTVGLGLLNDARRDLAFCFRRRRLLEWPHAVRIRWCQRRARLQGFREGWRTFRQADKRSTVLPPFCSSANKGGAKE